MPRVVPSQAVSVIETIFPSLVSGHDPSRTTLNAAQLDKIAVILGMVNQIPEYLLTLEGQDYAAFIASKTMLTIALSVWQGNTKHHNIYAETPGFGNVHPIIMLRECLLKCPDEVPAPGTARLDFIEDAEFRALLRQDVSTSHSALRNEEWKAATVIAGSVVEALLLWKLQKQDAGYISAAIASLVASRGLNQSPGVNLLRWGLEPMIEVSLDRSLIKPSTAQQCRVAKDFRNLIHPGRVEREQLRCSRGTAHAAIAAMEQVTEDLSAST